jgi:hypothetical protein
LLSLRWSKFSRRLSIAEIMKKAGIDPGPALEIVDLVQLLDKSAVIEKADNKG